MTRLNLEERVERLEKIIVKLRKTVAILFKVNKKQLQEQCEHDFQYTDETYDRKQCTKCRLQRFK